MITDLVEHADRNRMLVALIRKITAEEPSRHVLILSDRRAHCQYLHAQFPTNSGLYMGGMKESDLLATSTRQIIFGTFSQAHEGLDIPVLDTIILATPKSDIKQSIGRILRETGGTKKNPPKIFDILDQWSLLYAMYQKRKRVYKDGGFIMCGGEPIDEPVVNEFKGKCLL